MKNEEEDFILENKFVVKGGIKGLEKHNQNPFLEQLTQEIRTGKSTTKIGSSKALLDANTLEPVEMKVMHTIKQVDKAEFVKIFISEIDRVYNLPLNARKTFKYICENLEMQSGEVYLWIEDIVTQCGYSSYSQVHRALVVLNQCGFIAPSEKPNIWFINPNIFFRGDRMLLVQDIRLKKWKQGSLNIGGLNGKD
jgi:hypothetical protein